MKGLTVRVHNVLASFKLFLTACTSDRRAVPLKHVLDFLSISSSFSTRLDEINIFFFVIDRLSLVSEVGYLFKYQHVYSE